MHSSNRKIVTTLSSLALAAAVFGFAPAAQAGGWRGCSASTIRGAYGVKLEGIVQAPGNPERKLNLVASVTFDGSGKFSATAVGRINGDPLPPTFAGDYKVNGQCAGTMDLSQAFRGFTNVQAAFVLVDGGDKFYLVVDSAPPPANPAVIQIGGEAERIGGRGGWWRDRD